MRRGNERAVILSCCRWTNIWVHTSAVNQNYSSLGRVRSLRSCVTQECFFETCPAAFIRFITPPLYFFYYSFKCLNGSCSCFVWVLYRTLQLKQNTAFKHFILNVINLWWSPSSLPFVFCVFYSGDSGSQEHLFEPSRSPLLCQYT